ncbi:MAG TPA: serine/threonine-protein kinase [Polyangiaceae bacterium]
MPASDVIGGKYRLVRLLGRGSMGEVWSARHETLDERVAVKLLTRDPDLGAAEDQTRATARFRFEAQVAARLSRKTRHVVRVTDHGEQDGAPYLVMELLEGKTLAERLLLRGTLPPADVAQIVVQAARALEIAHAEGIVHRDLKPANIFLTCDEDGWFLVKLLDFGIARTIHTHRVALAFATGAGVAAGTPGYMSPQQARGGRPDPRFDLWALATVAHEALTGDLPVPGRVAQELFDNACAGRVVSFQGHEATLVGGLPAFFERAFAPRPEHRYASASELAAAFERAIGDSTPRWHDRSHEPSPEAPPVASRGSTLRMPASAHAACGSTPPSAGTQRTVTLAMVSPVTRRRGAIGSGVAIAGSLLLAASVAVVAGPWRKPSVDALRASTGARSSGAPAIATTASAASAAMPANGEQLAGVVTASPVTSSSPRGESASAPVRAPPPPLRPRLPPAGSTSTAIGSSARPPVVSQPVDRSATF